MICFSLLWARKVAPCLLCYSNVLGVCEWGLPPRRGLQRDRIQVKPSTTYLILSHPTHCALALLRSSTRPWSLAPSIFSTSAPFLYTLKVGMHWMPAA